MGVVKEIWKTLADFMASTTIGGLSKAGANAKKLFYFQFTYGPNKLVCFP